MFVCILREASRYEDLLFRIHYFILDERYVKTNVGEHPENWPFIITSPLVEKTFEYQLGGLSQREPISLRSEI